MIIHQRERTSDNPDALDVDVGGAGEDVCGAANDGEGESGEVGVVVGCIVVVMRTHLCLLEVMCW